jgi:hypothetical protein
VVVEDFMVEVMEDDVEKLLELEEYPWRGFAASLSEKERAPGAGILSLDSR